jgi:hypothetical protein
MNGYDATSEGDSSFSVLRAYHEGFGCYLLELKIDILSIVGEDWHVF